MNDAELIAQVEHIIEYGKQNQAISIINMVRENDDKPIPIHMLRDENTIREDERAKTIEKVLAAVKLAGVQHENVAGCLHTEGRIHQNSLDIKAIKGVDDLRGEAMTNLRGI